MLLVNKKATPHLNCVRIYLPKKVDFLRENKKFV